MSDTTPTDDLIKTYQKAKERKDRARERMVIFRQSLKDATKRIEDLWKERRKDHTYLGIDPLPEPDENNGGFCGMERSGPNRTRRLVCNPRKCKRVTART